MAELLNPHGRSLYTSMLRPPSGYSFDLALATTFSLDLPTLLTVPINLMLFGSDDAALPLADSIAALESLRRVSSRILVFCQEAQIGVPAARHVLYGMLEPVVYEARAPGGGAFHPKVWIIRFKNCDDEVLIKLAVLSRNLTRDRSWDLSLVLEGEVVKKKHPENKPLASLVEALPGLSSKPLEGPWPERLQLIADELMHMKFEIPGGFEEIAFHLLGLEKKRWLPGSSDELLVISPFVSETALEKLAGTSGKPLALISIEEELLGVDTRSLDAFEYQFVLNENTEAVEQSENPDYPSALTGLHAKAYVYRRGWYTSLALGSANATNAALVNGSNVEILAELTGRRSKVGKPEDILSPEGLGDVLVPYERPVEVDEEKISKRKELERAQGEAKKELCAAGLKLACSEEGDRWNLTITPDADFRARLIQAVSARPVTLGGDTAVEVSPLLSGKQARLATCSAAYLTGFTAFEVVPKGFTESTGFVLNLPVDSMPEERNAAIVREMIASKDGFLRYIALLLADLGEDDGADSVFSRFFGAFRKAAGGTWDDVALLEALTLAACREPGRLKQVKELIDELLSTAEGNELVPEDFLQLWAVFEELCLKEVITDG